MNPIVEIDYEKEGININGIRDSLRIVMKKLPKFRDGLIEKKEKIKKISSYF